MMKKLALAFGIVALLGGTAYSFYGAGCTLQGVCPERYDVQDFIRQANTNTVKLRDVRSASTYRRSRSGSNWYAWDRTESIQAAKKKYEARSYRSSILQAYMPRYRAAESRTEETRAILYQRHLRLVKKYSAHSNKF